MTGDRKDKKRSIRWFSHGIYNLHLPKALGMDFTADLEEETMFHIAVNNTHRCDSEPL